MATPLYIIVHHTAVSYNKNPDQFKATNQYHKEQGYSLSSLGFYCGYQYEINKEGKVYQARKDDEKGAHTIGRNLDSIGVSLDGNFDLEMPTENQIKSLISLVKQKMAQYAIPIEKVVPHRFYATYSLAKQGVQAPNTTKWKTWDNTQPYKSCWGKLLGDDWLKNLLNPLTKDQIKGQIINLLNQL